MSTGTPDPVVKQSWNHFYNKSTLGNDPLSVVEHYMTHAQGYDDDCQNLKFSGPEEVGKILEAEMDSKVLSSETSSILDIACGTGLGAEAAIRHGFKGKVDGIDGCEAMLEAAKKKGIFRNLAKGIVEPNTPMPYDDNSYDGLICIAALSKGHINPEQLKEFVRIAKPGGLLVFSVRDNESNKQYFNHFEQVVSALTSTKAWEEVKRSNFEQYSVDLSNNRGEPMRSLLCCYRKL